MPARVPAETAAAAKPRHDVDGDGVSDMIVMEYDQVTAVYLSSIKAWSEYTIAKTDPDPEASFKDLLPVGDVGGTTQPELLSLTFDGVLTLYEAGVKSTSEPLWSSRGWQIYNRLIATGDLTGDRRPDLLARDPAGDLWLYTGTGTVGKPFNFRVKVGSGWGSTTRSWAPTTSTATASATSSPVPWPASCGSTRSRQRHRPAQARSQGRHRLEHVQRDHRLGRRRR